MYVARVGALEQDLRHPIQRCPFCVQDHGVDGPTSNQSAALAIDPGEELQEGVEIPNRFTRIEREVAAGEAINHPIGPLVTALVHRTPPWCDEIRLKAN